VEECYDALDRLEGASLDGMRVHLEPLVGEGTGGRGEQLLGGGRAPAWTACACTWSR
jgi:hypothetical protein